MKHSDIKIGKLVQAVTNKWAWARNGKVYIITGRGRRRGTVLLKDFHTGYEAHASYPIIDFKIITQDDIERDPELFVLLL